MDSTLNLLIGSDFAHKHNAKLDFTPLHHLDNKQAYNLFKRKSEFEQYSLLTSSSVHSVC